jgi:hypothetical protein
VNVATRGDIDTELTLEIEGSTVTTDKFQRGVAAFFGVLDLVSRSVRGGKGRLEWFVQVKAGSNLVGLVPAAGTPPEAVLATIQALADGIATLEEKAVEPRYFDEQALKRLRDLGRVAGSSDRDDTIIKIWVKHRPVQLTHRSVFHIDEIIEGEFEDHGSVEGRLQMVSERQQPHFVIYDRLWDRAIRCTVPDHLLETAISSFRKRVEVYGMVKYRRDGKPVAVAVESIDQVVPPEGVPSFHSVRGILRNFQ